MEEMKTSVCMGTMNEEKAIAKVVADFRTLLGEDVEFVVTDSSTDRTAEIARSLGAKVLIQEPKGYGFALRTSILAATGDIIITTDCDDTYPVGPAKNMIELIGQGFDVVSGSRLLGRKRVPAMPYFNEFGNRIFASLTGLLYRFRCTDATTGFRAYRKEVIRGIEWTENTGLSLELMFKPAALGYKVIEIPIDYRERIGMVKLNPIKGGFEMLITLLKYKVRGIKRITKE